MTLEEFRKKVLNVQMPRTHKVRNSVGIYDGYKFFRKNKDQKTLFQHSFILSSSILDSSFLY
mgnify:CR=1 FL=1